MKLIGIMPLNNEITLQIGCRPMSTVVSKTIICYKNVWIDLMMPASIYNCFVLIINSKQLRTEQVAALLSEKWILWSPSSCQSLSVPMISKNIGHSPIIPALRWWKYINLSAFVVAGVFVSMCVCVCYRDGRMWKRYSSWQKFWTCTNMKSHILTWAPPLSG